MSFLTAGLRELNVDENLMLINRIYIIEAVAISQTELWTQNLKYLAYEQTFNDNDYTWDETHRT